MTYKLISISALTIALNLTTAAVAAGDPATGEQKANTLCISCHGPKGISTMPVVPGMTVPNLAGQYADYLAKALKDYRSGARNNPSMTGMSAGLTDEDIENLAAYFSSLEGLSVVNPE